MEYVQERVTTLHALTDHRPDAPTDRAAVVVPMTEREYGTLAAERVLSTLETVDPARVIVPLRASADRAGPFADWLDGFDLDVETLWCDGPELASLLEARGLDGDRGKGRDVWLALGRALDEEFVVVHDADTKTYSPAFVNRLLFPLGEGYRFSKGYYARVEDGSLYGRLFRLFFRPLVRALGDAAPGREPDVLEYLSAFRYALAGEFAATSDLVSRLRVQRGWGLEVGTLGEAFGHAGFADSAQVDLGSYEHDHRSVEGPTGLADMSRAVGAATLRAVEDAGVDVDYDGLAEGYREAAETLVDGYATDAAFNGLSYDAPDERSQVATYAEALGEPGPDTRLPAWESARVDPDEVRAAAREDLDAVRGSDRIDGSVTGDAQAEPAPGED
ncbi:glycosyltransferase-like protein [Halorubrum californiense DSM 19288]|uniref:Glycosyltransferase-like protein n=1 Tax=Halorubrum californiense DSM 19288 TaxID=1227465 RepID=M0ECR1_9EURY|nr:MULTISPECIES: glycosyltransferase-like protein [Halorubrum]ELZ44667.1 glycosyltransferase-like protein [Halorubrum californiense DSM 19288]TKX68932.1 glycosyl transferase family 2 [Halorubrum sp. GN11GM_10-3_MGM]